MKTITNRSDQPRIELAKNTWELFVKAKKSNDNRFLHEDLIIVRDDACTTEIKTFKSGSSVSNFLCWFEQTYCVSVKQDFKCTIPYNDEGDCKDCIFESDGFESKLCETCRRKYTPGSYEYKSNPDQWTLTTRQLKGNENYV